MTKEEILTHLDAVAGKLATYAEFKEVSLESGERDIMIAVAKALMPERNYNFNCNPCGGELMTILNSYYQREKTS